MKKLKWALLILVATVSVLLAFGVDYEGREIERRKEAGKAAATAAILEDPELQNLYSKDKDWGTFVPWISVYGEKVVGEKEVECEFSGTIVLSDEMRGNISTGWGVEGILRLRKIGREWVMTAIDYDYVRE